MTLIRVQVDFNELNALVDDLTDVVYFTLVSAASGG